MAKTERSGQTTGTTSSATKRTRASGNGSASRSGGSARKRSASSTSSRATAAKRASAARSGGAEEKSDVRDLLLHEMGDLLFAERRFLRSTRTLAKEAQEPHVRARVEEHVRETEVQIERLQDAFRALGERPKAEKCDAALGLVEEHSSYKREEKPSADILSAFDLGSGLRVEHYEIAGYKSAIAVARALGERECVDLLRENLREEMAMASFLEKNSGPALRRLVVKERTGGEGGMLRSLRSAMHL